MHYTTIIITTAIITASIMICCSGSVMQANIVYPRLGNYIYGGGGAGYGPTAYQKVSLIGAGQAQAAATALVTRSAAAVSVPVQLYGRQRLQVSQINPSRPFCFQPPAGNGGYRIRGYGTGLVEGAAIKKNGILNRLLLKKSQKLINCQSAELQHYRPLQLRQQMFVRPNCYDSGQYF